VPVQHGMLPMGLPLARLLDNLCAHGLAESTARALDADLVTSARRFEEQDVAMMSVALRAAGLQLRAADPAAMRDFLVAVNARAAEAAAQGAMTPRAEVSLAGTLLCAGDAQKLFVVPHSSLSDSCQCVHVRPVPFAAGSSNSSLVSAGQLPP
jgi:hypothetical protein